MEQLKIFTDIAYDGVSSPEKNAIKGLGINEKIADWVKTKKIKSYRIVNASITNVERRNYIVYAVFVAYTV